MQAKLAQADVMSNVTGYINAGGRGTRLNPVFAPDPTYGISKALLPVGNPPVVLVEHQINKLSHAGVTNVVVGVGDHYHVVDHIEGVYAKTSHVHALSMDKQLGNGGDLVRAIRSNPDLFGEHILIVNVDTLVQLDERDLVNVHRARNADLTIALTQKTGVPNEGAYYVGHNDEVVFTREVMTNSISEKEAAEKAAYRGSSTGALVIRRELLLNLEWSSADGPLSLYSDIVAHALGRGSAFAYSNGTKFFIDIGTVDTWNFALNRSSEYQPYLHHKHRR